MLQNRQVLDFKQQNYPKQQTYLQKAPQATNIRGNMTLLPPRTVIWWPPWLSLALRKQG